MAQSPKKKLQHEVERVKKYGDDGTLPQETTTALLDWMRILHPERSCENYTDPEGEHREFSILTVQTYLREMRKVAERAEPELLDLDPIEFNEIIDAMESGKNPNVKNGGLSKTTLMVTQSAAQTFFWYHGVCHPEEITVYGEASEPKHDSTDLFTRDEVQALRKQVHGPRNRAILEMLLNTGQRISAIQGLRIKDIDLASGYFYLNTDRAGLKGADRRGRRRPLLGAKKYVADWLDVHPFSDTPEAYVFIGDPDHHKTKPEEPLCQGTIRRMLELTAERAGVEKPVNPHNFRHYWTTTMKQEYGLNDEEIKLLMGHDRQGNGINAVYNHVVEEELRESLACKTQQQNNSVIKSLTPDDCVECGESLEPHWRLCPLCGTAYGPTARNL